MRNLLFTLALATVAFAQDQGRFTGIVADTTGAVIPGASIRVRNEKTGAERAVKSSDTGVFFVTITAGYLFGPWVGGVSTSIAALVTP